MRTKILLLTLFISLLFAPNFAGLSQSRSWLRKQIEKNGGYCRNVSITETNGDLILYGRNAWAASGCPSSLVDALDELNDDREYIDDVVLTENGDWLILYGDNGVQWNDIPYSMQKELKRYNNAGEVIYTATFNDAGDWIIITDEHYSASDEDILDWLSDGEDSFGELWTACVTNDAAVAVYEEGYLFLGDVPRSLKRALDETSLDVYRLKIAGDAWFFADEDENCEYYM